MKKKDWKEELEHLFDKKEGIAMKDLESFIQSLLNKQLDEVGEGINRYCNDCEYGHSHKLMIEILQKMREEIDED